MQYEHLPKHERYARHVLEAVRELHARGFGKLKIFCYVKEGIGAWRHSLFASESFPDRESHIPRPRADGSLPDWPVAEGETGEEIAAEILRRRPDLCASAKGLDSEYVTWFSNVLAQFPDGILTMDRPDAAAIIGECSINTPYGETKSQYGSHVRVATGQAQRNAARGAVLGALAGDAAGAVLEFLYRKPTELEIELAMRMPGGGAWKTAPGQVTDDGELTVALAHALAGQAAYDPRRAAFWYRKWYLSGPFDVGTATSNALAFGDPDSPTLVETIRRNAAQGNAESKANGSLMRASVLGAWSAALTMDEAVDAARSDAQLTHPNVTCQWAGAAYVVAVRHLVLFPGDAQGAADAAQRILDAAGAEEVKGWLASARHGDLPACYPMAGFVRIGFTYAFYHLIRESRYDDAISHTLAAGGDTDTNACIVGGLIGALHGADGIPEVMRNAITSCDTRLGKPRPNWLHTAQVENLFNQVFSSLPPLPYVNPARHPFRSKQKMHRSDGTTAHLTEEIAAEFSFPLALDVATGQKSRRPTIEMNIPVPSVEGIISILEAGGSQLELLQKAVTDVVYRQAAEILAKDKTLTDIPHELLSWDVIANLPQWKQEDCDTSGA